MAVSGALSAGAGAIGVHAEIPPPTGQTNVGESIDGQPKWTIQDHLLNTATLGQYSYVKPIMDSAKSGEIRDKIIEPVTSGVKKGLFVLFLVGVAYIYIYRKAAG